MHSTMALGGIYNSSLLVSTDRSFRGNSRLIVGGLVVLKREEKKSKF